MADNFVANPGAGGTTFAADELAGSVYLPRVKPSWGADGTAADASVAAPLPVQVVPTTNNGATPYKLISAASTNATSVKGSAGTILGIAAFNLNAAARYLKIYNKASAPTVGTDTPVQVLQIPGGGTAGAGLVWTVPIDLATGIAFALTTGIADSDTGAVASAEIAVNLTYK